MLVFLINIITKLKLEYWKTKSNSKYINYYLNTIQENSSQIFKEGSTWEKSINSIQCVTGLKDKEKAFDIIRHTIW